MSAPERIWVFPPRYRSDDNGVTGAWGDWPCSDATEYVGSDLVEAAVKRALEWATGRADALAKEWDEAGYYDAAENAKAVAEEIRTASPEQIAKLAKGET